MYTPTLQCWSRDWSLRTLHVGYGRYISYTLATTFVTFGYILPALVSLGRYRRYTFCYRRYRRYNNACSIITATRSPDVSSRGGSKPNAAGPPQGPDNTIQQARVLWIIHIILYYVLYCILYCHTLVAAYAGIISATAVEEPAR